MAQDQGLLSYLIIVGVLSGVVKGSRSFLMLGSGRGDAVAVGGRRGVADVLVSPGKVCGLHGVSVCCVVSWRESCGGSSHEQQFVGE